MKFVVVDKRGRYYARVKVNERQGNWTWAPTLAMVFDSAVDGALIAALGLGRFVDGQEELSEAVSDASAPNG